MSGRGEHKALQAAADDGSYALQCRARWEATRNERWVEDNRGRLWPRPGLEPKGFEFGSRLQRDNALRLERERKL